ncbi:hypothetical protein C8R45DRAFT_1178896 [Mycena sanguinolenta]|nr:hypothetical protein C8R45DRAFT_1178896 [Mycena sanguinolenta]
MPPKPAGESGPKPFPSGVTVSYSQSADRVCPNFCFSSILRPDDGRVAGRFDGGDRSSAPLRVTSRVSLMTPMERNVCRESSSALSSQPKGPVSEVESTRDTAVRMSGCTRARCVCDPESGKRWESAWNSCDHDYIQGEALRLARSPLAARAPRTRSFWHAVRQCLLDERDGIAFNQWTAIDALLKREWRGARCGEPENGDTMRGTCEDHLQPLVEWREVDQTRTMRRRLASPPAASPSWPSRLDHPSRLRMFPPLTPPVQPSARFSRFQAQYRTDARRAVSYRSHSDRDSSLNRLSQRQGLESPRTAVAHPSRASSPPALHLATSQVHSATIFSLSLSLSLSRIFAPAIPISSPQPHDLLCYMLLDSSPRTTVTHLVPTTANANEILCARSPCAFAVLLAEEIDACVRFGVREAVCGAEARRWAGYGRRQESRGGAGEEEQVSLPSAVRERARSREGGAADDSRRNSSVRHARGVQLHTPTLPAALFGADETCVFVVDGRVATWWIAWIEIHGQ